MSTPTSHTTSSGTRTTTTQWFDAVSVVFIVVLFTGVIAFDINIKREIAQVDRKIAELTKNNETLRSKVINRRKEQEALKSTKVAEYARLLKMCIPSQGYYVQVNTRSQTTTETDQEAMLALRKNASRSNVATITHTATAGTNSARRE